jgi:hypothetical protein
MTHDCFWAYISGYVAAAVTVLLFQLMRRP